MEPQSFRTIGEAAELVRRSIARVLSPELARRDESVDLVEGGLADSMAWVEILVTIEGVTGIDSFGNPWPSDRPQSIGSLIQAVMEGLKGETKL